jgi:hypothetical protein
MVGRTARVTEKERAFPLLPEHPFPFPRFGSPPPGPETRARPLRHASVYASKYSTNSYGWGRNSSAETSFFSL